MKYPVPADEQKRLQAIKELNLHISPKDDEYTALVELIAAITGCPISLISIVEKDRQWFKAQKGIDFCGTSRSEAFCSHTIVHEEIMIIEDAKTDERFCQLPSVVGEPHIRFYAGVPIKSPQGYAIGSVCVLDSKPRKLSAAKRKGLQVVANKVAELLWLRHQSQLTKHSVAQIEQEAELQKASYDAELSRIGYELHEDYAQSIAACMKFIEVAKSSSEIARLTIDRTYTVLEDVLNKMRTLSQQINPGHFSILEDEDKKEVA